MPEINPPKNATPLDLPTGGVVLVNREDAFLVYASFCGDVIRAGHALGLPPSAVLKMADDENWNAKLAPILELSKTGKPGDIERAMNRAVSFVQAHRMKNFLNRVMNHLIDKASTLDGLDDLIVQRRQLKDGTITRALSARALADLSSALEKCHAMAYHALGDTATERNKRIESGREDATSILDLHQKLSEAMSAVGASKTPRAMLFDSQLLQAEAAAKDAFPKESSPHDDDDH